MITIHLEPLETTSHSSESSFEQERNKKRRLAQTIMIIVLLLCITVTSMIAGCSTAEAAASQNQELVIIDDGWEIASLEEGGIDSEQLTTMLEDIHDGGYENLHSILIVKDGRLVFEEYFRGHNPSSIDNVASVTKSITSILIGIAIDQGFIDGPDQYLADLLPSYATVINADPFKQELQLWHILSMTSGIEWDEESYPYGDSRNDATSMERSSDPVQFILERPVIREPGTQFQYSGANSMLLSAILQEATGKTAADFASVNLFEPLGIFRYRWDGYADGHTNTDGGLSLRPRDMAKIGLFMLNMGQWDGVQIISPQWVVESTQAHKTVMPGVRYGYQWWREKQAILLESVEPYFAAGYGGQLITVYPDQDMIIVVTGETANHDQNTSRFITLRNKYLLPAAIPAQLSMAILWSWYLITLGGLAFIIFDIAKGKLRGLGCAAVWLLIAALFGPLGLAAYVFAFRNPQTRKGTGWKAFRISIFLATGNVVGIFLLVIYQYLFLPEGSVILLVIPASFLVNWLVFTAPLASATTRTEYGKAVRGTIMTSFISSILALIGLFPVIVLLSLRWPDVGPNSILFWIMMTAGGIAGVLILYPFILWRTRRRPNFWIFKQAADYK